MKTVLLKDLFQEKIQPKNYYKTKDGYWVIQKKGKYYFSSKNKDEVEKILEKLKECDWDKNQLQRIKKELGIVKQYRTNKTGFYRVTISTNRRIDQGYLFAYEYTDENNIKTRYTSKSLKELRKKVLRKGLLWKALNEDAEFIEKFLKR